MTQKTGDVDIDCGDRNLILQHLPHIPAAMRKVNPIRKHSTGVHITDIPYDPAMNMAAIDYTQAEERGYFKLDLLNVHLYKFITSENMLVDLMVEPDWTMLQQRSVVKKLIHVGNHYSSIIRMPEPINSVTRLAMFLAIIRPAKNHLIGKKWAEVEQTVWEKDDGEYSFKKSHSFAYAQLVVVNMNMIKNGIDFDEVN